MSCVLYEIEASGFDEERCIESIDTMIVNNVDNIINSIKYMIEFDMKSIRRRIMMGIAEKFNDDSMIDSLIEDELNEKERCYNEMIDQMEEI